MWLINILAFNLTIVFITELPLSFIFGAKTLKKLSLVALINVITNPAVVLSGICLALFFNKWQIMGTAVLEFSAFMIEGFMFSKLEIFKGKNPYLLSLVLNSASFISGEIINIFL